MASSKPAHDGGYATPAALVLSLALALIGSAIAGRSLQMLSHARADLELSREALALEGAQLSAAAAVVRSGGPGPYAWTFSTDLGWVEAIAEPESPKVGFADVAAVDDATLLALGVADPQALRARIAAAGAEHPLDVGQLDAARGWRDCGASLVSPFGQARAVGYAVPTPPAATGLPPAWRIGETWRIRVATPTGWRDDRIVRFTGDARRPVAVVRRTWSRARGTRSQCQELLTNAAGG